MATHWPFRTMWPKLDLWKLLKFCPKQKINCWTPKYTTNTSDDSRDEDNPDLQQTVDLPLVHYQYLPNNQTNEPFRENCNNENCHETSKLRWWERLNRDHGWSPCRNASHSIVELLGLGLFVAFGFRHRCNEGIRGDGDHYRRPQCRFLGKFFPDMHVAQDNSICLNVLPTAPATQVQKPTCQGSNPEPKSQFHVCEDEFDVSSVEHDFLPETVFTTLIETQRKKPSTLEPSLDVLRNQIESLASQYTARIQNANAVELAKSNKIKEALSEFKEASNLGSQQAKYNLGICYENGLGVAQDLNEAALMYKEAASLGHATAAYNLGVLHFEKKIENHDPQEAVKWMDRASRCGIKEAQRFMGLHYMNSQQIEKATSLFLAAAKQNDGEAMYFLGLCYEGGLGIEENAAKASQMFHEAAKLGNTEALYIFATYQEYGLGGLQADEAEAHKLYEQAAGQGHPLAMRRMEARQLKSQSESWSKQDKSEKKDSFCLHESHSTPILFPTLGVNLSLLTTRIPKSSTEPHINISIFQDFALHNFKRPKSLHLENEEESGNNYFLSVSGCSSMQT